MNIYAHDKRQSVAGTKSPARRGEVVAQFVDKRRDALAQRNLQDMADHSSKVKQLKLIPDGAQCGVVQRVLSDEDMAEWADMPAEDCAWMDAAEKKQLAAYKAQLKLSRAEQQSWDDALESRVAGKECVSWDFDGKRYHINLRSATNHVTEEASPKIHYFFEGSGNSISDKQPEKKERGKNAKVFSKLPVEVQGFIKNHYSMLLF